MPDIKVIKLKLRRGLDSQRLLVSFDQGELGYTIDSKRVFVGDGVTLGGTIVGSKFFTPTTNKLALQAYTGDVVYESSLLYQLTGTLPAYAESWAYIGPALDNTTIKFDQNNRLTVNAAASSLVYVSGGLTTNSKGISANVDGQTLIVNGPTNTIRVGTINPSNISSAIAFSGLNTTATNALSVNVDNYTLRINDVTNIMSVDVSKFIDANAFSLGSNSNTITLRTLSGAASRPLSGAPGTFGGTFNTFNGTTYIAATGNLNLGPNFSLSSAGFVVVDFGGTIGKKGVPIFNLPSEIVAIS